MGALQPGDKISIRKGIDAVSGDKIVTVKSITKDNSAKRVYNLEIESLDGENTHNYFICEDELWVHNAGSRRNPTFGELKDAYKKACGKIGGCKGLGKFKGRRGGASRGDTKCGIRFDPPDSRRGWHINWWDYRKGKRGRGGCSGHCDL